MASNRFGPALTCTLLIAVGLIATGQSSGAPPDLPLELISPMNNTSTELPTVLVTGTVTPGASVAVNGVLVEVSPDGSWSVRIALDEGLNTIRAHAWDSGGSENNTTVEVTFNNPAVDLRLELADTLDEINATQEELSWTQDYLEEALADLADTMAELDDTRAHLDENASVLSEALAEMDAMRAEAEGLGAELESTEAGLAEAQADIGALRAELEATNGDLAATEVSAGTARARADEAAGAAGAATLVGVLGMLIGGAGVGMGFRAGRRGIGRDDDRPEGTK